MNKNRLAGAAVIIALAATLGACSTTTESEPTAVEAAGLTATPKPDEAQGKQLLAEFEKVNAHLAHERNIGRSVSTCKDILDGKDEATLVKNAKFRFSGSDYESTDADGTTLVNIVKNNGFCVAA